MSVVVVLILLVLVLAFYLVLFSLLSIAKQADEVVWLDSEDREFEKSSIGCDSLDLPEEVESQL
jgi:hypothetical protein